MLVSGNNGYRLWGMRIMEEFFSKGTVALSDIFPVVTMCDVDIRTMGKSVLSVCTDNVAARFIVGY